jgi:hypothetical protein
MSQRITTYCDICNIEQDTPHYRAESWIARPRKELKEFGWKFIRGMDKCPACVDDEKKGERK